MNRIEIREPIQKRSIEKKEKIIKSGFELICQKGYYNTNTAQIAKNAGVSTGIVYSYFKDKHDIFIESLEKYADHIFYPMLNVPINNLKEENIETIIQKMIYNFIENHKLSQSAHEEIMAMAHSDKEVAYYFYKREMDMTIKLYEILSQKGFQSENLMEKIHISIGLIDNICHEIVYHKHETLDYDAMINIVVTTISDLLKNK
ncbi:MAG: TetR/AcrR family transcriptional regulator [Clostridia bacterium]|nr:TetR/AcrR family transcriptional regulator [Clostridia bacterium]